MRTIVSHMITVLIVEDNSDLLMLYAKAITSLKFQVDAVTTVSNALELVNHKRYDIIICDMRLNGKHGTELLAHLHHTSNLGTEVIIVSGEDHYRETCSNLGFDLFMTKPVSIRELKTLASRLVQNVDQLVQ